MFGETTTQSSSPVLIRRRDFAHESADTDDEECEHQYTSEREELLFQSVYNGHLNVLKKLLRLTADPNICDLDGASLLHAAVTTGDVEILCLLLEDERCDINLFDANGQTALMNAVIMEDLEMVKILVKSGAELNRTDRTGKTALLLALQESKLDMAEYLIKQGCDVNMVDRLGQSALYLVVNALDLKCVKIVKKLLKAGYSLEKDKAWMKEEGFDVEMVRSKNFVTKIVRKIAAQLHKLKKSQSVISSQLSFHRSSERTDIRVMKIYE